MDWSLYLEHLESVLKKFDVSTTFLNDLFIPYFRDGLQFSIRAQLDKRNRNLDDWQEIIKRFVDAKAKAFCQVNSPSH